MRTWEIGLADKNGVRPLDGIKPKIVQKTSRQLLNCITGLLLFYSTSTWEFVVSIPKG